MARLRSLPIHFRLLAMVGLLIAGLLLIVGNVIQDEKRRAVDARVTELHALVQAARGIATNLQSEEVAGRMAHDAAVAGFRSAIRAMRYGSGDYIFVYTNDGTVVAMPPAPELEGKNRIELKDPAGHFVIRDLIEKAAQGGGILLTAYPRPGTTTPIPKMNYVEPFQPWNMLIATGVFVDDLEAEAQALMIRTGLITGLAVGVAALLAWLLGRSVSRPLGRLEAAMTSLAGGDLSVSLSVSDTDRGDEIGRMARAVGVFKDNAGRIAALQLEQQAERQRAVEDRRQALVRLADQFDTEVRGVVNAVATAGGDMGAAARKVSGTAGAATEQSGAALIEAEQATANVQSVAAAIEEMAATGSEISRQVSRAATISREAAEEGRRTNDTVAGLAAAAQKVGDVVKLIQDIAAQTNLLALNATIEAARAGDAGKGFAVVAGEVKSLANQTARATEDIRAQIASIQAESSAALAAIRGISATVHGVEEIAAAISSTVDQQGSAILEVSGNIQQAAARTEQVASHLRRMAAGLGENGAAADAVLTAADLLGHQASVLRREVDSFLGTVRAA